MRKLLPILDYVVLFVAVAGAGVAYAFLEYGGGALIGATYALSPAHRFSPLSAVTSCPACRGR